MDPHHYIPDSREGSKQWVKPGESVPKRLKMQQSSGKVIASVFWNAPYVIYLVYYIRSATLGFRCVQLNTNHPGFRR